jgi:death-on-curing protein
VDFAAVHDFNDEEAGLGVRDYGLVLSALARPEQLAAYGTPDAADLAAAYAVGIALNHGFIDGNKRTAWATSLLFLTKNGYELTFSFQDVVSMLVALVNHLIDHTQVAAWYRERITLAGSASRF